MKNKLIKLLILVSIVFFSACNDTITNSPKQDNSSALSKNIGKWHNKALALTYQKNKSISSINEIRDNIIDALEKENSDIFNQNTIKNSYILSKYNPYKKALNKTTGDSTIVLDISEVFIALKNTGEMSNNLYTNIMSINNDVENGNIISSESLLTRTQNLSNLSLTEKDKYFLDIYMQVINSSNQYWNSNQSSLGKVNAIKSETIAVIWADAAGAAYGLLVPNGIWSIIEGAIFSTVAAANYE